MAKRFTKALYNRLVRDRENTLSWTEASNIWKFAWARAEAGDWTTQTHRSVISEGVSAQLDELPVALSGDVILVAEEAIRQQHRDKVLGSEAHRGGFTYGYQWAREQPPELLRFPMEFRAYASSTPPNEPVRIYPVEHPEAGRLFLLEFPGEVERWHRRLQKLEDITSVEGAEDVDVTRIAVALDWHDENGVSLNPFKTTEWMPPRLQVQFTSNPAAWMNDVVEEWIRRWDSIGELWWLDTKIVDREQWAEIYDAYGRSYSHYEVRSLDVWGNARDGYEVNNSFRVGEVVVPEDGDVIQALLDAGHLRDGTGLVVEDNYDFIEVLGPEEEVDTPERMEPEGSLPESFADEVWQWAWEATVDQEFGEMRGEDGAPLERRDVEQFYPTAWNELAEQAQVPKKNREDFVEEAIDDAFRIAQAAYQGALDATRNDSRIPLLHLQLIEDE